MKLALCTFANTDAPVEDLLAVAAEAGYDGVEIWGRDHLGDRSRETCEAIGAAAERRGLDVTAYGSYLRPGTPEYEGAVETELEIAGALGASLIRVWAGSREYSERTEDHWNRAVSDLRDLAERAEDRGLGVTVEKHEGTLTNAGAGARRLIEAVDREACGLNWQPLFGLPADEIRSEARDLAGLSNNVHLQAVPEAGRTWRDRCLLEDAHFDVSAALGAFADAGFDGHLSVECVTDDLPFADAVRRDREYLTSIVG